jgi:Na+-driven multidrug efflux pump
MGAAGLWWGLTIGLSFSAMAMTLRFLRVSKGPVVRLEG